MELALAILSACLILSLAGNVTLAIHIRRSRKQRPDSYELKDFMRDMLERGLLEVRRVDPTNIMLRSPRDGG